MTGKAHLDMFSPGLEPNLMGIKEVANCFNIFCKGKVCRFYLSFLSSFVAEKNI
jgi:hypothetical protein